MKLKILLSVIIALCLWSDMGRAKEIPSVTIEEFNKKSALITSTETNAILKNLDSISFVSEEELESFFVNYISKLNTSLPLYGIVKNSQGNPIKSATVVIEQIRDSLSMELKDQYEPIKLEIKTNNSGEFSYVLPSTFNKYRLGMILASKAFPKANFKITVKADGYRSEECEFVNINRETLMISMNFYGAIKKVYSLKGGAACYRPENSNTTNKCC